MELETSCSERLKASTLYLNCSGGEEGSGTVGQAADDMPLPDHVKRACATRARQDPYVSSISAHLPKPTASLNSSKLRPEPQSANLPD